MNWTELTVDFDDDCYRHDDHGDQKVGDGERRQEVVGHVPQSTFRHHRQTQQNVAEHRHHDDQSQPYGTHLRAAGGETVSMATVTVATVADVRKLALSITAVVAPAEMMRMRSYEILFPERFGGNFTTFQHYFAGSTILQRLCVSVSLETSFRN